MEQKRSKIGQKIVNIIGEIWGKQAKLFNPFLPLTKNCTKTTSKIYTKSTRILQKIYKKKSTGILQEIYKNKTTKKLLEFYKKISDLQAHIAPLGGTI